MRVRIPPRALTVRAATRDDAPAIAEIHVASWRAGYRGLVADEILAGLSVEQRRETWETIVGDGRTTVLVAGEPPAGFVAFLADGGEIGAPYVDPERFRAGVGSALLEAAHEAIERAGRDEAVLWVLAGNEPAFAFYARHGYAPDGATAPDESTGRERVRLARQTRR